MAGKPVIVNYSASDFLGGTILLDPWEELAFRRLCDLIYITGGDVPDDKGLATFTKTGKRWPKIRRRLIELNKIEVRNDRLSQGRCRDELGAAEHRMLAASKAGRASVERRNALKGHDTASTTVATAVERTLKNRTNAETNDRSTNHDPRTTIEERKKERGGAKDALAGYAFEGQTIRLTQPDLDRWRHAYTHIADIIAELTAADDFYTQNPPKDGKWFFAASNWLRRANEQIAAAKKKEDDLADERKRNIASGLSL